MKKKTLVLKLTIYLFFFSQYCLGQQDTTRFDQWLVMVTPTTMLNARLPSFEFGFEYNPKGSWGYGINYGFGEGGLYKEQTHQLLRIDLKHYRRVQTNATYFAGELMVIQMQHRGDGISYLGNISDENIPVVKAFFKEFDLKASLKIGRRVSADIWRFEYFIGIGLQQRNLWHHIEEVTSTIHQYPQNICTMRCSENYFLTSSDGYINKGFRLNLSLGLKVGFIVKRKKSSTM